LRRPKLSTKGSLAPGGGGGGGGGRRRRRKRKRKRRRYSTAVPLLYSQCLKIFPYKRMEKMAGICFEPNSKVKGTDA
jgi:hypothetical protein